MCYGFCVLNFFDLFLFFCFFFLGVGGGGWFGLLKPIRVTHDCSLLGWDEIDLCNTLTLILAMVLA